MASLGDQVIALLSKVVPGMSPFTGAAGGTVVGQPHGPETMEKDYKSAGDFCGFLKERGYQVDCNKPTWCDPDHSCLKFNGEEMVCTTPDMYGKCDRT